jgi:hypothetical protein
MIVVGAGDEPPRFVEATPFQIDAWDPWNGTVDRMPTRATRGEYFGITFLRSGGIGVVSPVQHLKDRRLVYLDAFREFRTPLIVRLVGGICG